jgi:hypothetical protein
LGIFLPSRFGNWKCEIKKEFTAIGIRESTGEEKAREERENVIQ